MFDGLNDAAKFSPSGPPLDRMATDVTTSEPSSRIVNVPSTLAPTSTWHSRQQGHQHPGHRGPAPPGQHAGLPGEQPAEEAVDRQLDRQVGEHGNEGRGHAEVRTEPAADVGEEGAGVGDAVAHRRIADAEQQQREADEQVRARCRGTRAQRDGGWQRAGHPDERPRRRHDEEDDAPDADLSGAQGLAGVVRGPPRRCGVKRWCSQCSPSG